MQGGALEKILAWLRSGESVALTCYEREAGQCHRHCIAATLEQASDQEERPGLSARPYLAEWGVRHL